ncbi:MAG TPA: YetF domain-containing protein [Blastocatellia bacterium]
MDPKFWSDLLHPDVSILEKIVRPVIVYVFLIIGLRLAGKRELAQLNPFDLVVLLTLSNTVQNAIIGNDNSVAGGLIGAATLLTVNYFVVRFLFKHEKLERLVEGDADVLIENGEIKHDRLRKELITLPELKMAAHKQGFASFDEVDRAVLEPGGTISFSAKRPTPEAERHAELMAALQQMRDELAMVRAALRT